MLPDPQERLLAALSERGAAPRRSGSGWIALCPAHEDRQPSLSVGQSDTAPVLLHCFAGCEPSAVLAAVGLSWVDLLQPDTKPLSRVEAEYRYEDEGGRLLYVVERRSPKSFLQKRPSAGGWEYKIGNVRRVPYRLPELLAAIRDGRTVYVVEGEKDVESLRREGVCATCNSGGAGKWNDGHSAWLRGANVVVIPDHDEPGRRHGEVVATSLATVGVAAKIVELEGVDEGGDVTDWLMSHSVTELERQEGRVWQRVVTSSPAPRLVSGAVFLHSERRECSAIWGEGEQVLWASGESLLIVGRTGVGKSTLAQLLVRARLGLDDTLLGFSVKPDERPILYVAADRPPQIRRSMSRMFDQSEDSALERLLVWRGPLERSLTEDPFVLRDLCMAEGAGTLVVDSLKDVALNLSKEDSGTAANLGFQSVLAEQIEVVVLHHQRKRQQGAATPNGIEDVYGSAWITSGAGSVVYLGGSPGSQRLQLSHLKQPQGVVGPLTILHDRLTGAMAAMSAVSARAALSASSGGLSLKQLAEVVLGTTDRAGVEKMRREMNTLVAQGDVIKTLRDDSVEHLFKLVDHDTITDGTLQSA